MITNTGPHVTRILNPEVERWVRVAPIVKALDDPTPLVIARDDAWRVFRAYFPFQDLNASAGSVFNTIVGRLNGYKHPKLYLEMYVGVSPDDWPRHSQLLLDVQRLAWAQGYKMCGPSWYDGNGEPAQLKPFEFLDAWAFQGYWGNTPTGVKWWEYEPRKWHALRHRYLLNLAPFGTAKIDRPTFVTESGRDEIADEGTAGQAGWLKQGVSAETYLNEIDSADAAYKGDGVYTTLYTAGPYDTPDQPANQGPFATDQLAAPIAAMTQTGGTPPVTEPTPPNGPVIDLLQPQRLLGFDVSSHQGQIDCEAAADTGRSFVWIKASESDWYVNPEFSQAWRGADESGLVRGAYLYAQPSECSPAAHVTHFQAVLDRNGGLKLGDLIALDVEEGTGDISKWVAECLDLMERVFHVKPVIYTGEWFARPHGLWIDGVCGRWPLWLAEYGTSEPRPPWPLRFWQFTEHGRTPGVAGESLEDVFLGTLAELTAMGKQA